MHFDQFRLVKNRNASCHLLTKEETTVATATKNKNKLPTTKER